ncbi:MAG TPA: ATP-binding cassette domain-containing protein, partial [Chloroflexota bacterium]|nr:ATP-binding cassette domain-containing protein [Chloroflexota bacterium]
MDAVDLVVREGSMLALAGPNGSGKTTLLRVLAGLLRPSAGSVTLDGEFVGRLAPRNRARRIAVVSQRIDPNLLFTTR